MSSLIKIPISDSLIVVRCYLARPPASVKVVSFTFETVFYIDYEISFFVVFRSNSRAGLTAEREIQLKWSVCTVKQIDNPRTINRIDRRRCLLVKDLITK